MSLAASLGLELRTENGQLVSFPFLGSYIFVVLLTRHCSTVVSLHCIASAALIFTQPSPEPHSSRYTYMFLALRERGLLFVAVRGLLIAVASLVVERGLQSAGSVVVAHGLSCSVGRSCGVFPDQGQGIVNKRAMGDRGGIIIP